MVLTNKFAVGESREATAPDALKAALAEFIGTFLFVFVGLGSASAYQKVTDYDAPLTVAGLLAIATAHGLGIIFAVASTARISGGHINPAVTFGLVIGGRLTLLRGILYWIGQLVGAVLAALILKFLIVTGEPVPIHTRGLGVGVTGAIILELILTFALVWVIYATAVDANKGPIEVIAPIVIGFTVLAAILIGAPFSGASLNPARSFGPALVNLDFTDHYIYWVGPLVGAAIAALVYDGIYMDPHTERATEGEGLLAREREER